MPAVTRGELLEALEREWGTYVERYSRLSGEEKKRFLKKQGYTRFADILAHFIAWWEEGLRALERMSGDPAYQSPDYSVDEFNERAIERFSAKNEEAVIRTYENLRRELVRYVTGLPEDAFRKQQFYDRLHVEILGHLEEHKILEG